jgi:hypothetical protein
MDVLLGFKGLAAGVPEREVGDPIFADRAVVEAEGLKGGR